MAQKRTESTKTKQKFSAHAYYLKHKEKIRAQNEQWKLDHPGRMRALGWDYWDRLKVKVFTYYSHGTLRCAQCGFANIDALCLDHINDDGAAWRRAHKINSRQFLSGRRMYQELKTMGFPPGLQVLCANCNLIKERQRTRDARIKRAQKDFAALPLPAAELSETAL